MSDKPSDAIRRVLCVQGTGLVSPALAAKRGIMSYWRQPLDRQRIQVPIGIVHVIEERCKGCGFCVEFCPRHLLVISERVNSKGYHPPEIHAELDCVNCGLCALLCPDFAIYVVDGGSRHPEKVFPIRRQETRP